MNGDQAAEERAAADEHAVAANAGDVAAAGAYLERNLPYLSSIARWLARDTLGAVDPDDLAAEAIANLLTLWSQGRGPLSNPNAYLIRSMRNRIIDAHRSPRSRVQGLSDAESELPPEYMITRDIDLHREYGYVRQALSSLPQDQQTVLRATVIEGRKPAELEHELGRPASAIHALAHRARVGLRRATLRIVLTEDAPEECRRAAGRLPKTITMDVDESPDSAGMSHIRTCERCRAAWGRFGGMSTLGLVSLLVAGNVLGGGGTAEASEDDGIRPESRTASRMRPRPRGRDAVTVWASVGGIAAGIVLLAISLPAAIGELSAVTNSSAGTASSTGAGAAADFEVTSLAGGGGRATLDIRLRIDGELDLTLALPPGVTVAEYPAGWDCTTGADTVSCALSDEKEGIFALTDDRADQSGVYRMELSGDHEGRHVAGFAQGTLTAQEQTVRVDRLDTGP